MTFAELLKSLREKKCVSQEWVSKRSGLSVPYICALERGHRDAPPLKTLVRLAHALEADIEELKAVAEKERKEKAERKVAYELKPAILEVPTEPVALADLPQRTQQLLGKFANDSMRLEALSNLDEALNYNAQSETISELLNTFANRARREKIKPPQYIDVIIPSGIPDFHVKVGEHLLLLTNTDKYEHLLREMLFAGLENPALEEYCIFISKTKNGLQDEIEQRKISDKDKLQIYDWSDYLSLFRNFGETADVRIFGEVMIKEMQERGLMKYDSLRVISGITSEIIKDKHKPELILNYEKNLKKTFREAFPEPLFRLDINLPHLPMLIICTYHIDDLVEEERAGRISLKEILANLFLYHDKVIVLDGKNNLKTGSEATEYVKHLCQRIGQIREGGPERTRKRIIEEAIKLFAREGFNQTTTRVLASRVGVTEATLYYYFENKEAILEQIFKEAWAAINEKVRATLSSIEDTIEKFAAVLKIVLDFFAENPDVKKILICEARPTSAWFQERLVTDELMEFLNTIDALFIEGKEKGLFQKDFNIQMARQFIFGGVENIFVGQWWKETNPQCPIEYSERDVESIWQICKIFLDSMI